MRDPVDTTNVKFTDEAWQNNTTEMQLKPLNRDVEDLMCFLRRPADLPDLSPEDVSLNEDGQMMIDPEVAQYPGYWDQHCVNACLGQGLSAYFTKAFDGDVLSVDDGVSVLIDLGYEPKRARNLSEIAGGFRLETVEADVDFLSEYPAAL